MSSIPQKEFTADYYNEDYFKTPKGKKFRKPDGSIDAWSYANPDGESSGCGKIVDAWKKIFQCQTMLDVGAGRGTLVAYARQSGIEAHGFDFSEWAVNEGRYPKCELEWLRVHDATKPWPYPDKSFDLVTCFPKEIDIMTEFGWKQIDLVQKGDTVRTHQGWAKVSNTFVREYQGELIKVQPRYAPSIRATPEHRFLAVKRRTTYSIGAFLRTKFEEEWIEAKDLKSRDLLVFNIPSNVIDKEVIDVLSLVGHGNEARYTLYKDVLDSRTQGNSFYKIRNNMGIPIKTAHQWARNSRYPRGVILEREKGFLKMPKSNKVKRYLSVDQDFAELMGLYLGDGSTNRSNVMFSYNSKDTYTIERTKELVKKVFGVQAKIENSTSSLTTVVIPSQIVTWFFRALFGRKYAPEKEMPAWFLFLPPYKQKALIQGLILSDGSRNDVGRVDIVTTSRVLARQSWLILLRIGILANLHQRKLSQQNHLIKNKHVSYSIQYLEKPKQTMGKIVGDKAYFPIYKITREPYNGLVHNLETEHNAYLTISGCVHNCLDLLEHIYEPDLPFVISELHRVSKKWIFLQTAIAGSGGTQGRDENGYILKKGEPVPIELEGCAAAGHVTLKKEAWWYEKLEHDDWMPRKDMVNWFISLVDASVIRNWLLNSIMIWERI